MIDALDSIDSIDAETALVVCAGPSLDRLSPLAWRELGQAGVIASINGALAAHACRDHGLRFTYVSALDVSLGLLENVPDFGSLWATTPGWRITQPGPAEAETYVHKAAAWSDEPDRGFAGGSSAMVTGNWLCNAWPDDPAARQEREAAARRSGKAIPRRSFRKLAYLGLDMVEGVGAHARGAGNHRSGFTDDAVRDRRVRDGWRTFCEAARARGVEIVNLTPGTGLAELPRRAVPASWLL